MYILKRNKLVIGKSAAFILGNNILDKSSSIPSGIITIWSGSVSSIPSGWVLCDGNNNTPDLRNRFIVGAGNKYAVGNTGGEEKHTLTVAEIPSHNHSFSGSSHSHTLSLSGLKTDSAGAHTHTFKTSTASGTWGDAMKGSDGSTATTSSAGAHTHTITGSGSISSATTSGSVGSTGSGSAHNNMPPYYALCYIMKQ